MSSQAVLTLTGVALVGVVAGFFTMLHFAGTASQQRPPQRQPRQR